MLRAHSQRQTDAVHVCADVFAVDDGCSRGGREHASQDRPGRPTEKQTAIVGSCRKSFLCVRECLHELQLCNIHGGGLPGPIVAKKGSNLALKKADAEAIYGRSETTAKHLDQVLDNNTLYQVS